MILATDVQYDGNAAIAAGVLFESWDSDTPHRCLTTSITDIAPYEAGQFYKRELPCILALLKEVNQHVDVIIIDGFVTLGHEQHKGLGMHLYEALDGQIAVVGVAKRSFKNTPKACEVYRGNSEKPLYVTSVGISLEEAILNVRKMHGKHRIPALLKETDQICRRIKV